MSEFHNYVRAESKDAAEIIARETMCDGPANDTYWYDSESFEVDENQVADND